MKGGEEIAAVPQRMTTLEFPEIEKTGGCDLAGDDVFLPLPEPRVRAPGKARSRFSAAAAKVLTQVVVSRQDGRAEHASVKSGADARIARKTPTRTYSDSEAVLLPSPARERVCRSLSYQKREERRSVYSFASVVRLASFRYRHMVSLSRIGSTTPTRSGTSTPCCKPEDVIDEPTELPVKPRFCATLSPEAQYAMLKGYEDILREKLGKSQDVDAGLLRVRTPQKQVVCLHLTDAERPGDETAPLAASAMTSSTERNQHNPPSHDVERRIEVNLAADPLPRRLARPGSGAAPKSPQTRAIPKKKQLRLSYRFERAMDLIDGLKAAPRSPETSSRRKARPGETVLYHDPVVNYNKWSRSWVREFKLEYSD